MSRLADDQVRDLAAEVAEARHINPRLTSGITASLEELLAARTRITELEAQLTEATELLDGAMRQGAVRCEDGSYDSAAMNTWVDVGEYLVAHAGWTRPKRGRGRRWWYTPPEVQS